MGQHVQRALWRSRRQGQDGDRILLLKPQGCSGGHDGPIVLAAQKAGQDGDAGRGYQGPGLGIKITVMPQPEFRPPAHVAVELGTG